LVLVGSVGRAVIKNSTKDK